jgi:DNA-binding response OmpR family regulator
MKVLIIEDEALLRKAALHFFHNRGYVCESATQFSEALEKVLVYNYDCIIVDLQLPGGDGLDIIKELKKHNPAAGIIITSSRNSTSDKIKGLETGADDYLAKPFEMEELEARIKSIIRRRNFRGVTEIEFGDIRIEPDMKAVTINSKSVTLTGKEYDLLLFFISTKGRLISKDALIEQVWGDEMDQADNFDFIYTHVKNLRKKIIEAGGKDYLKTVYGQGYRFLK